MDAKFKKLFQFSHFEQVVQLFENVIVVSSGLTSFNKIASVHKTTFTFLFAINSKFSSYSLKPKRNLELITHNDFAHHSNLYFFVGSI